VCFPSAIVFDTIPNTLERHSNVESSGALTREVQVVNMGSIGSESGQLM
jgi:hypothetical protein